MWEMQVRSQDREDTPEKEMTAVFLPGKSHGQKSLEGLQSMGSAKELDMTQQLNNNCIAQGTLLYNNSVIIHVGKVSEKEKYVYMYNWITLLYTWN